MVRFLLMLTDDLWGPSFYRCGHCSQAVESSALERHAADLHGIKEIKVLQKPEEV